MLAWLLVQYNPDGTLVDAIPYLANQSSMGRQPFSYVEIDLDYCANAAGIAPCAAIETGDDKCYNTFASCNDTPNFNRATKTYRFCSANGARVPRGLDAIPCLRGLSITPAEIDAGKGLGLRAACSISLQDFPHSDIRVDPYVDERTYIPVNRGTYFGKLKARNPYYNGRVMRVYNGYLNDDGSFTADKFERRTYFIDGWDSVDASGITKISGKDILKLADDERAVAPAASIGKINADMTTSSTSIALIPTGVGSDYPASGYARIGSELMSFTRSGDVMTVVRAQKGTAAATHAAKDTVQLCLVYAAKTAQNIVYDLLVNYAGVNPSYIAKSDWDAEQTSYLPRLYSALITAPTGVSKLLTELSEQIGFFLFWDEVSEKIRFQTIRPNSPSETVNHITSQYHLLADTLKLHDLNDDRVNEVWVYYGVIDPTKNLDEESNYQLLYVSSNVDDQGQNRNRDVRIKKLLSRWITDSAAATELANRYLERYALAPVEADFALDAKDGNLKLADFVQIESPQYQDFDGSPLQLLLQVIKRKEIKTGTTWAFTARQFAFSKALNPVRQINIDVDTFDLDLKAAHDSRFAPAVAGTIVEITIKTGVLVSASSAATYALTNPNTWAAGVIVRLIVEAGAYVVGRGGNGARGGRAFYENPPTHGFLYFYGKGLKGGKGGNGLKIRYPLTITNNGVFAPGGGGGGSSGGAIAGGPAYARCQSGSGGGGGWPYGAGGRGGQISFDDSAIADYSGGDFLIQIGNAGDTMGGLSAIGTFGLGGASRTNYGSAFFYAEAGKAGNGANVIGSVTATSADASHYATTYRGFAGAIGAAGDAGDFAVNGNSFITWAVMGTIYGAVV